MAQEGAMCCISNSSKGIWEEANKRITIIKLCDFARDIHQLNEYTSPK